MQKIHLFTVCVCLLACLASCSSLDSPQNCTLKVRSACGTPTACQSSPPFPFTMTAVITLDKKFKWAGANSWKYNLEDAPGNLIPFDKSGCMSGQPQAGEFGIGENITLHVVCNQLSKPLIRGDKLWVFVFSDSDNPDNWLMFTIPIQGYSSSKPSFTHLPQNLLNHQRSSNQPPKSLSEELSFSSQDQNEVQK